ncbi:MAG: thioredoxin domain-containing protein [Patescibacteria group bacterium]
MQKHEPSPVVVPTPTSSALVTYILLAIVIVQGFFNIYLLTGNSVTLPASTGIDALGVKKALLELEYEKVGGKENYELVSKATLIQMQEQIPQIRQFIESNGGANGTATAPTPAVDQVMDAAQIEKIVSSAALEGNTQADIIAIEYSDMECPFCIRQYSETKLRESLVTQYGDKVAFAFKNNRGVNHSGTEAKAVGALCAKKVGGNEAYAKFYHAVMDGTTQSAVFPVANLGEAAKTAGVDIAKWQACYDAKETAAEFLAETQEANGLGLGGTPGTLILNVKTGKYTTVEGAYPLANFVQKIDSLMN